MDTILSTQAELNAEKAENLKAFSGFKLLHIKREITTILGMIGRTGIFDEYTVHDINHINSMLDSLNWIIPDKTKKIMSHADWLLTVLAVYFHDLGMLVTKHEYEERHNSDFHVFCETVLFGGDNGKDYKTRIEESYPEDDTRERFLYQEFVRHNHAHRIKLWITGEASNKLGVSVDILKAVQDLLSKLDTKFKRDLALVCESHHLDDLSNNKKYYTSQPYGNSDEETANIQYSAILLRTADLLHITSDRTPSIAFRVINPSDPISQREWAKQAAVQRVRPQAPIVDEDRPDLIKAQDTIEVHALFNDAEDFFGLTSYLAYADNQIKKSSDWINNSQRLERVKHEFPWRHIDTTHIEAVGFLPSAFSFELDQARVLDLLTGHTLYNDTGVVIRELVQNSMDAIRLQDFIKYDFNQKLDGNIFIHWDSIKRVLTVRDNGTGMTQDIVEKHLLKAGSSRYRDPEFQKKYPSFSAISRFGIGVLSCFMIADDVEITTFHEEEEQGRHLSLRSVHGKYLIRLLDKDNSGANQILGPHGTEFRLRLRPSAALDEIISIANRWIVVPNCFVKVQIDNDECIQIGHSSPKKALEEVLSSLGYNVSSDKGSQQIDDINNHPIEVREKTIGATTLAYAVEWSPYFKEWDFLSIAHRIDELEDDYDDYNEQKHFIGTCIEGIRIDSNTPGYEGTSIAAIANATGPNAPKTNVARSNIETTTEQEDMLKTVYSIYVSHIESEVIALQKERDFSPTWAAQEGRFLARPLIRSYTSDSRPLKPNTLMHAISKLPLLIGEKSGDRHEVSPLSIQTESRVWTVESAFLKSAEELVKEVNTKLSVRTLLNNLGVKNSIPDEDMMLSSLSYNDIFFNTALEGKEISKIVVDKSQRSANFLWTPTTASKKWIYFSAEAHGLNTVSSKTRAYGSHSRGRFDLSISDIYIASEEVLFEGLDQEIGVKSKERILLNYDSELSIYLRKALSITTNTSREQRSFTIAIFNIVLEALLGRLDDDFEDEVFSQIARANPHLPSSTEAKILLEIVKEAEVKLFDPWAWSRSL